MPNANEDLDAAKADAERARARQADAEAEKALAEARESELRSEEQQLNLEQKRIETSVFNRLHKKELASDENHRVYRFGDAVSSASVKSCQRQLMTWHRVDPGCDIEIVFNSPGGSVIDGVALYDTIRQLSRQGHKITTGSLGYAASMAGILLQAGDHRWIGAESILMIHEISAGATGKIGEIKDSVKFYDMLSERVVNIFVNRCGGKTTREAFIEAWARQDWWLDSDASLAHGFVDEIR